MARQSTAEQAIPMGQFCSTCAEFKPWTQFHKSAKTTSGYQSACKGCQSEYRKQRHRRSLSSSKRELLLLKDEAPEGTKVCPTCRETLPLEQFYEQAQGRLGRRNQCIDCVAESGKKSRAASPRNRLANGLSTARVSSRKRGLPCEISLEHLVSLWERQRGKCHYTGVTLSFDGLGRPESVSLDRVDSTKGYVADNVVLCCNIVNLMKNKMTVDELVGWCHRIINHRQEVGYRPV